MRLIVVGGGFSGVSTAVQVARYAPHAWQITLVEPDAATGRGLAYSTADPDHRLNGPISSHCVDPLDTTDGDEWAARNGLLKRDPDAQCEAGIFPRRADFALYLADSFRAHAAKNPSASTMTHRRNRVVGIRQIGREFAVDLDDGTELLADQVVLATGNPAPRLPASLRPWATHPAVLGSPWQAGGLRSIAPDARVTVMGSSLTAADVLATLIRQAHRGPITVFSRRGLRPRAQRPADPERFATLPSSWLVDMINAPVPAFLNQVLDTAPTLRGLVRAVRAEIKERQSAGEPWQAGFDALRDVVWQVWPRLPLAEKQRFMRHLRPWYDVHRFRMSPPTSVLIDPAVERGQIRFVAARLNAISEPAAGESAGLNVSMTDRSEQTLNIPTDAFVNCSGLDLTGGAPDGSLEAGLLVNGLLSAHPTGLGYQVAAGSEAIGASGLPVSGLRLIGPPTAGEFGDPLGAMFISVQIRRMLPALFQAEHQASV